MEDYGGFDDNLFDDVDQDNQNDVRTDEDALDNVIRRVEADVKSKRKIQTKPQPKLTERELTGEKGLCALRKLFENYQSNEKKSPYDNLDDVMQKIEYWGHLLFPKATFDDVLTKVENVGRKRAVKVYMTKLRHGMPLFEDDTACGPITNAPNRSPSPLGGPGPPSEDSFDAFGDDFAFGTTEPSKPADDDMIDFDAEWAAAAEAVTKPASHDTSKALPQSTISERRRSRSIDSFSDDFDDNIITSKAPPPKNVPSNDSDGDDEPHPTPSSSLKTRHRRRLILDSDDEAALDSDDDDTNTDVLSNPPKRAKLTIESDSEDENPENIPPISSPKNSVKRRKVIIDSDDDEPMDVL